MLESVPGLLSAVVGDVFGAREVQAGNVTGAAVALAAQRVLRRRAERSRETLLAALRRGERTLSSSEVEEAVAMVYRHMRAAQEGAARLNLRLMAEVIAGQACLADLRADEFLQYADILASLRRDEVIYLGALQRHWTSPAVQRLPDGDRASEAWKLIAADLVPVPFPDMAELGATADAVLRTGFLLRTPAVDGDIHKPSRWFLRLCELVPIETAIRAEPA